MRFLKHPVWQTRVLAAVGAAALLSVAVPASAEPAAKPAKAQKAKGKDQANAASDAETSKRNPELAQRAYAAGVRAAEAGNHAEAVSQLSAALSNGGLPNAQMARALYLRGAAYRQEGKPAQAIADLTSAVWLKNGLTGPDRTKAMEARKAAYQEAGLGEPPPIGPQTASAAAPKSADGAAGAAPSGGLPQPAPGTQVAVAPPGGAPFGINLPSITMPSISIPGFGGSSQQAAAPAPAPQAEAPQIAAAVQPTAAPAAEAAAPQVSAWDASTAVSPAPVPAAPAFAETTAPQPLAAAPAAPQVVAMADPQPAAAPAISNPLAGAGNAIGGFFSSVFGGGAASATSTPSTTIATGSTGAPQPAMAAAEPVTAVPDGVAVSASPVQRAGEEAAAPVWATEAVPAASAAPSRAAEAPRGKPRFKLQVAAVRSREEADRVVQAVAARPEVQALAVQPEVDEAVYGGMGKFYRVRIGPYADAVAPNALCKSLRPQGYDCLVVSQ